MSFEGVQQAFAIQAGREVRIIVKPEAIDDLASARLARDVAKKIEETMQYPGQIRVTVIRETRSATAMSRLTSSSGRSTTTSSAMSEKPGPS